VTKDQIYAALTEVFHDVFDDDSIVLSDAMTAADVPDWDSQNHINLILAAENRFGIRFRTAELDSLKNVGEFVALIQSRLAAPARG
jgi:acyl carrier protein